MRAPAAASFCSIFSLAAVDVVDAVDHGFLPWPPAAQPQRRRWRAVARRSRRRQRAAARPRHHRHCFAIYARCWRPIRAISCAVHRSGFEIVSGMIGECLPPAVMRAMYCACKSVAKPDTLPWSYPPSAVCRSPARARYRRGLCHLRPGLLQFRHERAHVLRIALGHRQRHRR